MIIHDNSQFLQVKYSSLITSCCYNNQLSQVWDSNALMEIHQPLTNHQKVPGVLLMCPFTFLVGMQFELICLLGFCYFLGAALSNSWLASTVVHYFDYQNFLEFIQQPGSSWNRRLVVGSGLVQPLRMLRIIPVIRCNPIALAHPTCFESCSLLRLYLPRNAGTVTQKRGTVAPSNDQVFVFIKLPYAIQKSSYRQESYGCFLGAIGWWSRGSFL